MSFTVRLLVIVCCLGLFACGGGPTIRPLGGDIADLRTFPQDLHVYADQAASGRLLLSPERQQDHWSRYKRLYFSPWQRKKPSVSVETAFYAMKDGGYGGNLLRRPSQELRRLVENADQAAFPNLAGASRPGVILRNTALRAAPTHEPKFNNPQKAGEGYPFDMWQVATFPIGMPIYITHVTKDSMWVFVENSLVSGWVLERDVAPVDSQTIRLLMDRPLLAVVEERVPIREADAGLSLGTASIGSLLYEAEGNHGLRSLNVLVPVPGKNGYAQVAQGVVADIKTVVRAPAPITPGDIARVGNRLMGQAYGWGSLNENRDCSAMLRDVLTPFGIWLPRNSAAQAKAWSTIDLSGKTPEMKERIVQEQGRPFSTLLAFPGHIGLYVGSYQGRAAMFHDMWGIRTLYDGREGRYIVGQVAVTSVNPGAELEGVNPEQSLAQRMRGMSILQ